MALFTVAELSTLLGRTVDATTGALALELATGLVEGELGSPVESTTSEAVLPVDPLTLTVSLPGLVVTEVTSVEVDGAALTADQWVWPAPQPYLRLLVAPDWDDMTATVVYDHGLAVVPAVVKAVALSAAARIVENPTGLRSESIDDYSATRAGSDLDLAGLTLTNAERVLLSRVAGRGGAAVTGSRP